MTVARSSPSTSVTSSAAPEQSYGIPDPDHLGIHRGGRPNAGPGSVDARRDRRASQCRLARLRLGLRRHHGVQPAPPAKGHRTDRRGGRRSDDQVRCWLTGTHVVPRFFSFLLVPLFMLLASGAAAATPARDRGRSPRHRARAGDASGRRHQAARSSQRFRGLRASHCERWPRRSRRSPRPRPSSHACPTPPTFASTSAGRCCRRASPTSREHVRARRRPPSSCSSGSLRRCGSRASIDPGRATTDSRSTRAARRWRLGRAAGS